MFKTSKIMCVGDDSQSIYSFRGSSINFILNSNKIFDKIYLLSQNYRSTNNIVNFCNNIIKFNNNIFNKSMIATKENGSDVIIKNFNTQKEQYNWIINDIISKNNSNCCIIARNNHLLNNIESYLIKANIEYNYDVNKPYIKDILAFITILENPNSSYHWKQILLLHFDNEISNNILKNKNILSSLKKLNKKLFDFITLLKIKENKIILIKDYIKQFYPLIKDDINHNLTLTTIHGSKGLEWTNVYIIDTSSKYLPSIRPTFYLDELELVEEERRLLYVAASRAKENLCITYINRPSSFLKEIQPKLYIKPDPTFDLFKDCKIFLNISGYYEISKILKSISYTNLIIKYNKLIKSLKPLEIKNNYIINYLGIEATMDMIGYNKINNNYTIINFISNHLCVTTLVSQLLYSYLFYKNNLIISNIIIFNHSNLSYYNFNISNIDLVLFKKLIYN